LDRIINFKIYYFGCIIEANYETFDPAMGYGTLAQQEINLIGPQISLPLTGYFAFLGNDEIILYHDFER
jgi:hypothetical protein